MKDYILRPGQEHFWVDLQPAVLSEIESGGRIILDNPNYGNFKAEVEFTNLNFANDFDLVLGPTP